MSFQIQISSGVML